MPGFLSQPRTRWQRLARCYSMEAYRCPLILFLDCDAFFLCFLIIGLELAKLLSILIPLLPECYRREPIITGSMTFGGIFRCQSMLRSSSEGSEKTIIAMQHHLFDCTEPKGCLQGSLLTSNARAMHVDGFSFTGQIDCVFCSL